MKQENFISRHLDLQLFGDGGAVGGTGAAGTTGGTAASGENAKRSSEVNYNAEGNNARRSSEANYIADVKNASTGNEGKLNAVGAKEGAAVPQRKGAKNNPLADVLYGKQEESTPAAEVAKPNTEDRNAKFEAMIKGEFKDLYDARMQDTIKKRLKTSQETVDRYNALTPTLEILAKKYGVDANDAAALNKAIEEDDSYFEEEALEKGISVEELKRVRAIEKENSELKRTMAEKENREKANRFYAKCLNDGEALKAIYPSFDLESELKNPDFAKLLMNNVSVRTAYEVMHKDEIIGGAMQFAARETEKNVVNKVMAQGARPQENGISAGGASTVKSDVSKLTKADRAEINRRVARGEKITF